MLRRAEIGGEGSPILAGPGWVTCEGQTADCPTMEEHPRTFPGRFTQRVIDSGPCSGARRSGGSPILAGPGWVTCEGQTADCPTMEEHPRTFPGRLTQRVIDSGPCSGARRSGGSPIFACPGWATCGGQTTDCPQRQELPKPFPGRLTQRVKGSGQCSGARRSGGSRSSPAPAGLCVGDRPLTAQRWRNTREPSRDGSPKG